MATSNFKSMADFPLIAKEDMKVKYCPHCEMSVDAAEKCGECGADLSDVESEYDEIGMMELGIVARFSNGETIYTKVA